MSTRDDGDRAPVLSEARTEAILAGYQRGPDGVWGEPSVAGATQQEEELSFRRAIALEGGSQGVLERAGRHHSVEVMDVEVRRFLSGLRQGAVVLDMGGGWGWHWRELGTIRPDLTVLIVDLVRENLFVARDLLGNLIDTQVFLVHGDGLSLQLPDSTLDGYWSVQSLQHVPSFGTAIREAHRVLSPGGRFASYSLNNQALHRWVYAALGRHYHVSGRVDGAFLLERASEAQRRIIEEIFGASVDLRYSEVLFHPDLRLRFSGRRGSVVGRLDAFLGASHAIFKSVARQCSFHVVKPVRQTGLSSPA